jgi:hypothetical protein
MSDLDSSDVPLVNAIPRRTLLYLAGLGSVSAIVGLFFYGPDYLRSQDVANRVASFPQLPGCKISDIRNVSGARQAILMALLPHGKFLGNQGNLSLPPEVEAVRYPQIHEARQLVYADVDLALTHLEKQCPQSLPDTIYLEGVPAGEKERDNLLARIARSHQADKKIAAYVASQSTNVNLTDPRLPIASEVFCRERCWVHNAVPKKIQRFALSGKVDVRGAESLAAMQIFEDTWKTVQKERIQAEGKGPPAIAQKEMFKRHQRELGIAQVERDLATLNNIRAEDRPMVMWCNGPNHDVTMSHVVTHELSQPLSSMRISFDGVENFMQAIRGNVNPANIGDLVVSNS